MNVAQALIQYASSGGKDVSPILSALAESRRQTMKPHTAGPLEQGAHSHHPTFPPAVPSGQHDKGYVLPTSWSGTHVTDGLGWGTKTAEDIMLAPGTPLDAPVPGTVLYYHLNGAQGGGSEMFQPDAGGHPWWIGHVDAGRVGHVNAGGYIARVSSRHPRPHVHIDRGLQ